MSSLSDKLRRIGAAPKRQTQQLSTDCLVTETRFDLSGFSDDHLSATLLQAMGALSPTDVDPRRILFIDTETTGFARGVGTVAFVVGLGYAEEDAFVVRQYVMRDYPEEPFVLHALIRDLERFDLLVSYNGRSFDLPVLDSRLTMNRLKAIDWPDHIDMLLVARRVFKRRLKACGLAAMEEEVLGYQRLDDLPGSEAPKAYFTYLANRDLGVIEPVMKHNALDIQSLMKLFFHVYRLYEQPASIPHGEDLVSLGAAFEKARQAERARQCYRFVKGSRLGGEAGLRLALSLKRDKQFDEAADTLDGLRSAGLGNVRVYVELAKIYEHRFRDPWRALEITRQGMIYCLERMPEDEREEWLVPLRHRQRRLLRKTEDRT